MILRRNSWLALGVLIVAAGVVTVSVMWWWWAESTLPPWMGVGEWDKCANEVPVQPDQAIHDSARLRGLSFSTLRAKYDIFVNALYVNRSGHYAVVDCAISTTTIVETLPKFLSIQFEQDHYGWIVSFYLRGEPTTRDWHIVDWFTGQLFVWGHGPSHTLSNATSSR